MSNELYENAISLNPRYISSGFSSQARNISKKKSLELRKLACLTQVISKHILKYGHKCHASSCRLLKMYNSAASKYNVKPISDRTLTSYLKLAEAKELISRTYEHDYYTGQTFRFIDIGIKAIKSLFEGVFNLASNNAIKNLNRHNLRSGRSDVDNAHQPSSDAGLEQSAKNESCGQRSKDQSKDCKDINIKGAPSDSFYVKFFGVDANEAKSLQQAARDKRLTASGARKLIGLHNKHGFELAKSFKRYLNSLLMKEHEHHKYIESLEVSVYGGTAKEALYQANQALFEASKERLDSGEEVAFLDRNGRLHVRHYRETMPTEMDVNTGRAEYYRDRAGRVQVRWLV